MIIFLVYESIYEYSDGTYSCKMDLCHNPQKRYPYLKNLRRHQTEPHAKPKCKLCPPNAAPFEKYKALDGHYVNSHGYVKCDVDGCFSVCKNETACYLHKQDVHCPREFCTICGKSLANRRLLRRHIDEQHEDEETWKFECETCHGRFQRKAFKDDHEKLHKRILNKKKEVLCPLCKLNVANNSKFMHPCQIRFYKDETLAAKFDAKSRVTPQYNFQSKSSFFWRASKI